MYYLNSQILSCTWYNHEVIIMSKNSNKIDMIDCCVDDVNVIKIN